MQTTEVACREYVVERAKYMADSLTSELENLTLLLCDASAPVNGVCSDAVGGHVVDGNGDKGKQPCVELQTRQVLGKQRSRLLARAQVAAT